MEEAPRPRRSRRSGQEGRRHGDRSAQSERALAGHRERFLVQAGPWASLLLARRGRPNHRRVGGWRQTSPDVLFLTNPDVLILHLGVRSAPSDRPCL